MESKRLEAESAVSAVTIYQGRAMITRTAELKLSKGNYTVIFPDLPANLDRESIQAKGTGDAVLGECIFETEYSAVDVDDRKQALNQQIEELNDKITELSAAASGCDRDKALIEKIASLVTTPSVSNSGPEGKPVAQPPELNAAAWNEMLTFYHDKHRETDKVRFDLEKKARSIRRKIEKATNELNSLGHGSQKSRNIIKVSIEAKKEITSRFSLSYTLSGPTWWPVYNVRSSADSDKLLIEYNAVVRQGTGENWDSVEIKLSTANVSVSGVIPKLYPWRLQFYVPQSLSYGAERRAVKSEMKKAKAAPAVKDSMEDEIQAEMAAEPDADDMMYSETAEIETGGTSVVFSVPGLNGINGDNTDTKVSLMQKELPSNFRYTSVPKLVQYAYLTAEAENETDFPFLPGPANIFFEDSFVSSSALPLIMPGEKLEVSLGVDERIKIEYRFLKRYKKNEGLVNKKISEQFDYQIRITNTRKIKSELKVFDQLPIAQEKDITVKMLTPVIKESRKDITMDDENRITWNLLLDPGEKKELPFSFIIEYPQGQKLNI